MSDGMSAWPIGERLRHARDARQLSLAQVAERSGLSKSFLSRVERETESLSVASLIAVCEALGLNPADLFERPQFQVVRASDRHEAHFPGAGVHDTLLTSPRDRRLTVIETLAPVGGSGGDVLYSLPCETEVLYVVEGSAEIAFEDRVIHLDKGDCVTFDGTVRHTWRQVGDEPARLMWVLAPGLPDPIGAVGGPEGTVAP